VGDDLHVAASGSQSFVDGADRSLQVSPLTPAGVVPTTTTTTSTTTVPSATPSPAISASFVSPDHGWVLQENGSVVRTTDGGRTWSTVGRAALTSDTQVHLRFADDSQGFVFTIEPTGKAPLLETTDGGVHWTTVRTPPVSAVSDVAISRGRIYLVGVPVTRGNSFPGFRIWSTPVGRLDWSIDPLTIPVGAGPVPFQRLTFAGNQGWMVNNDRDLISGARLSAPTGRWVDWKPPCAGGAQLAASTSQDLVLFCGTPFAAAPTPPTISFSHDGGQTFTRHTAPESGPVATPNGTTAIVTGSAGVERTTDGGVSWHGVFDLGLDAVDLGFTTPTQGFIVFSNGTMLMTHDAGATWQKVTLP
jgi:photosystem II stability/assembly factor-like uncharacterized protein